ncbi:MAG: bifunctional riboflavin kinase/FMN adenylyltransferase, partial [Pelagerythrobacter marensis]
MRWLDHREPLPEPLRGAIIALGNFDGFHLGHQAVAGEAIACLAAGASAMLVLHFDAALAGTTAEDFVSQLMHRHLGVAGIVTGEDFTFGKGRAGNRQVLADLASQNGIATRAVAPVMDGGAPISSSRIRQALRDGDPVEAARLLTRPYAVRGIVVHGDK